MMTDPQATTHVGTPVSPPKNDTPPGLSPVKLPKAVLVALLVVWLGWVGFLAYVAI